MKRLKVDRAIKVEGERGHQVMEGETSTETPRGYTQRNIKKALNNLPPTVNTHELKGVSGNKGTKNKLMTHSLEKHKKTSCGRQGARTCIPASACNFSSNFSLRGICYSVKLEKTGLRETRREDLCT